MQDNILDIIEGLGIEVISQTNTHYLCLCKFHENNDSPAFEIDKRSGLWLCFNQSCGAKGNLPQLVHRLSDGKTENISRLLSVMQQERIDTLDVETELLELLGEKVIKNDWDDDKLESLQVNYDSEDIHRLDYLLERGFTKETLRFFEVGYSDAKQRIVIPVRDENFRLVGVIGRAIDPEAKSKYLYSDNLPKKNLLFNVCHAKSYSSIILVEGSLDCMKVFQSGFPNVAAVLGSGFSEFQAEQVNRHFQDVIVFSDNDDAGRGLHVQIQIRCPRKNIYFVEYPEGLKDPGEMTSDQIRLAIETKRSEIDVIFEELKIK